MARKINDKTWKPYNDVPLQTGEVLVPMRVNRESAQDFGANMENLRTWTTAGIRYLVMFVPALKAQEEEAWRSFNKDLNLYLDEMLGAKRHGHEEVSYEELAEKDIPMGVTLSAEDAFLLDSLDDLLDCVADQDPLIGTVLRLGWEGNSRKEIVQNLPVKKPRAYDVIKAAADFLSKNN